MITYRFWSEFQIVGAANENDLQAYFFNFADGTDRKLLEDLKLLDGLLGCNISVK